MAGKILIVVKRVKYMPIPAVKSVRLSVIGAERNAG